MVLDSYISFPENPVTIRDGRESQTVKKYVCLLLPFLFSPLASGQNIGDIKKLLDLKDYVAKVNDSVTNHQPMPVPPDTNWAVSEVSQRLDALDAEAQETAKPHAEPVADNKPPTVY